MTVQEFVKKYKINPKTTDLKKHIVNKYVPFIEKVALCNSIVNSTSYKKVGERDVIMINTPARYILFVMHIINTYTDLDVDFTDGNFVKDYDALKEVGLIEAFTSVDQTTGECLLPISEYEEFNVLLNMALDDLRDNQYSLVAMFYNLKESLHISEDVVESVIKEMTEKMSENNIEKATDI